MARDLDATMKHHKLLCKQGVKEYMMLSELGYEKPSKITTKSVCLAALLQHIRPS